MRVAYEHMVAETDAVMAAFAHDNLDLATDYRMDGLVLDIVPHHGLTLDLTSYLW